MLALLLGLGGLQRERANGTALFTLSLPVRRAKLVAVRAGVALVEMTVLALIPALLLPLFSSWHYGPYPSFAQSFHFSLLWMGAGTVLVAFGLLIATVVPGDYPAAAACIIALFAYVLILKTCRTLVVATCVRSRGFLGRYLQGMRWLQLCYLVRHAGSLSVRSFEVFIRALTSELTGKARRAYFGRNIFFVHRNKNPLADHSISRTSGNKLPDMAVYTRQGSKYRGDLLGHVLDKK